MKLQVCSVASALSWQQVVCSTLPHKSFCFVARKPGVDELRMSALLIVLLSSYFTFVHPSALAFGSVSSSGSQNLPSVGEARLRVQSEICLSVAAAQVKLLLRLQDAPVQRARAATMVVPRILLPRIPGQLVPQRISPQRGGRSQHQPKAIVRLLLRTAGHCHGKLVDSQRLK